MSKQRARSSGARGAASAALAGLLLSATACGSDEAVPGGPGLAVPDSLECFTGSLSGAGSSAQENAMITWIAGYQSACEGARVYYDSIGSGGGRSQFIDDAVDFAGTDAAMGPEENAEARERCAGSDTLNLPAYVVAIAAVFTLEGVDSLNLAPDTLARIFNRDVTRWDAPEIAEANPGVDLPDLEITPVNRSDDSGTTENFTRYLSAAAPQAWPHEPDGQWPIRPRESAQGNSGIADTVKRTEGAIGYVEMSHMHGMSVVNLGVGGEFVEISPEAAAQVVAGSPLSDTSTGEHDLALDLDYGTTEPGAYPMVLVSYEVVCSVYPDADTAAKVQAFLRYIVSPEGQDNASEETGSAPVNDRLREQLLASIDSITVQED